MGRVRFTNVEMNAFLLAPLAKSAGGRATGDKVYFKSKDDPNYKELLAILKEAKAAVDKTPRMDMPGGKAIAQERNFGRTF